MRLMKAAKKNNPKVIGPLCVDLRVGANIRYFYSGRTPLIVAAQLNHLEYAEEILQFRAKVNKGDRKGWTPLHHACNKGHLEMVRMLLQRHADIDQMSVARETPLMIAAWAGQIDVIKYLLAQGADITLKDYKMLTAVEYAVKGRHFKLSQWLEARWKENVDDAGLGDEVIDGHR